MNVLQILLIVVSLIHCTKIENSPTPKKTLDKQKILKLVNEQRSKGCWCGDTYMPPAKPLVWNRLLEKAAQAHSNDMEKNNFFSHTGSKGSNLSDRVRRVGYKYTFVGENIAYNYKDEEAVVRGWIGSVGHCKNIMYEYFEHVAVALNQGYWTMVLGRK